VLVAPSPGTHFSKVPQLAGQVPHPFINVISIGKRDGVTILGANIQIVQATHTPIGAQQMLNSGPISFFETFKSPRKRNAHRRMTRTSQRLLREGKRKRDPGAGPTDC
jgi:hypothetical protein